MNVPINGLRVLAVETIILTSLTLIIYFFLRFVQWPAGWRRRCEPVLAKNWRAVLLVFAFALCGRALLLPWIGIPRPRINDEFSYLLMADTFAHFRLTNPTPPAWPHFETFHVNLVPTYHSKYPVAQGLVLAFGEILFHQPWIGIFVITATLCGAICWTLQAFVPPGWALIGGLLATVRIAFLSYWMNSYWGGSVAALGGALALGAVVRLFAVQESERRRALLASVFALSLLILATSRPYEGLAFSFPLVVYFVYKAIRSVTSPLVELRSTFLPVVVIGGAGLLMMGYYNQRTTGNPLLLPHLLNERTYSPLPLFLWQKPKAHLSFRDPVFAKFYATTEKEYGYEKTKSLSGVWSVEGRRLLVNWLFYCDLPLSLPIFVGLLAIAREPRLRIAVLSALCTVIAVALCTYDLPHYAAPATVTVYIFASEGLRYMWEQGRGERAFVAAACLTVVIASLVRQAGSTAMNSGFTFPDTRDSIAHLLEHQRGRQLVLASYDLERHYPGDELVHNGADFRLQKILWARSKGQSNDSDLCSAYSDRTFWSVTTDDVSFSLSPLELCSATNNK